MKKIFALVTLTVMIALLGTNAYGGHSESIRRYCFFWLSKRYYAQAHMSRPGMFGGTTLLSGSQANCTGAMVHLVGPYGVLCEVNSIAHSQANWFGAWGYLWLNCRFKGGVQSPLYDDIMSAEGDTGEETPEYNSQETRFNPEFNDESVTVSGITISMQSDVTASYDNTYTLTLWTPLDDSTKGTEDSVITADKTLHSGTVTLKHGELFIEGDIFTRDDFNVTTTEGVVNVEYVGGDKHLSVPPHVTPGAEMALTGTGDVKEDEGELLKKVLADNNGVVKGTNKMNIYPNPASGNIYVNVNAAGDNMARIRVYDLTGKVVMEQSDVALNKGSNNIVFQTNSLAAGQYYVVATGKDMKIVSGFIKK
jgi:hypothetical protein